MIDELARVVLTRDLPEHGLRAWDLGTVVLARADGAGYTVEFVTLGGDTVTIVTVPASAVRPVRLGEIAPARALAHNGPDGFPPDPSTLCPLRNFALFAPLR